MRATFGRVAVVGLLSIGLVGCESARNMFAWGKKKPSDSALAEAPKFGPTLPSNGQTPGSLQNNVPGTSGLTTTTGTLPSASATMPYSTMPAGYQQSAYPTTPYAPAKLGAAMPGTTSAGIGTPSTTNSYAAGGYGTASTATTPAQPQSGFYNPGAYAGASPSAAAATPASSYVQTPASSYSSAPSSYVGAPATSSYGSTAATSSYGQGYGSSTTPATTSTMPATAAVGQPDYRTADARNAAAAPANSYLGTSATGAPAAAGANGGSGNMTNSYLGTSATMTTNPYSAGANSYNSTSAPAASAPATTTTTPAATAWPPTNSSSLPPAAGATGYTPGATGYQPGNTGYNPPDAYSPPASSTMPATQPSTRSDPGYRPGGTSNYTPGGNVLRPGASTMQSLSRPASGVVPASYSANATASGATAVTQASATPPEERYGSYQGSDSATSISSSSPTTTHSW